MLTLSEISSCFSYTSSRASSPGIVSSLHRLTAHGLPHFFFALTGTDFPLEPEKQWSNSNK